ncbi:MAG: putative peptidoglycan glycosyltransferase FtsW [Candidatus Eisenbacteria bacterium]
MDKILLFAVLALTLVGLVMVYSSSYTIAPEVAGSKVSSYFLRKHVVRIAFGFLLLFLFARIGENALRTLARPLMIASIALLVLTLLPTSLRYCVRGSSRWLKIGGFSFQPSEVAKIALVVYLADFVSRKRYDIRRFANGFLPAFLVIGMVVLLVAMEPNIGTAVMLLLIGLVVLFAGGARPFHLTAGLATCAGAMLTFMWVTGYNWDRIDAHIKSSDQGAGYHLWQSLIAIGAGGLRGVGVGMGNQKYLFVPDAHTDFVFAITAEEIGLLGMLGIIGLFFVFVWRGLKTARRAQTVFSSVMATGITMAIAAYFCVSAGVCTGLLPTAGLPMPFMSYGGTSSMILLASCGMLLGVSRRRQSFIDLQPSRWRALVK